MRIQRPLQACSFRLSVRSKARDEAVLQDAPYVEGGIEDVSMDGHNEGDPLVVGGVRGIVNDLQLHDAHYVGLVLRGDVGGAMDPTVILSQVGVDALELAAVKTSSQSSEDTHFTGYARFEKVWAR